MHKTCNKSTFKNTKTTVFQAEKTSKYGRKQHKTGTGAHCLPRKRHRFTFRFAASGNVKSRLSAQWKAAEAIRKNYFAETDRHFRFVIMTIETGITRHYDKTGTYA